MKPEMTDQELDYLLSELESPVLPDGLTARVMAKVPERKQSWWADLLNLFGLERLVMPAAGAFASVMIGLLAGYALVPMAVIEEGSDEAETALALAFGNDTWLELAEETSQ